jgi:hypothetical protein
MAPKANFDFRSSTLPIGNQQSTIGNQQSAIGDPYLR